MARVFSSAWRVALSVAAGMLVPEGVTDHMPSVPSGAVLVYAFAVPEMKYSACS